MVVDRHAGGRQLNDVERGDLIERERRNLMVNHECTHEKWKSLMGSYRCEECHNTLPLFIYECQRCNIMACKRCKYNRL